MTHEEWLREEIDHLRRSAEAITVLHGAQVQASAIVDFLRNLATRYEDHLDVGVL